MSQKKTSPALALFAGATAGGIEGYATYPFEYMKTQSQFARGQERRPVGMLEIGRATYARHGIKGFYSGVGALVAGNSLKAGVRFLSYDSFKRMMMDENGKLSGPRSLLAGLGAGVMEAVFAVTPSETIKTKLIDDQKSASPRYRGLVHGTVGIVRDEGIGGVYRGLFPVVMRQSANSAVRFGSYSWLKALASGSVRPGEKLPTGVTFGIGALAGVITVYATMPLDVIKTRMQSLDARAQYRNSFHCAARVLSDEGVLAFWRGATPRLARLSMSGGIVFTVYEAIVRALGGQEV